MQTADKTDQKKTEDVNIFVRNEKDINAYFDFKFMVWNFIPINFKV
jgi:hypothetical protein